MRCSPERLLMGFLRLLSGPWSFWSSLKYIMLVPSQQGCHDLLDQGPTGLDVLATECAAIHMRLLRAAELGISDFLLALDSQEVVALLRGDGELWSNLGNIVDDIRRLLVQLCVSNVLFQPRLGNRVAHSLVQFGL
ncbi:unnamed protein product, partial [Prunus brigantina]